MTKQQIVAKFIETVENNYGKTLMSDITVARAVEILMDILEDD